MNDQLELFDVVSKCVKWNSERYDQILNKELSISLLDEEIGELFNAETKVEKLDAIGDILFVAIGVLWKSGADISVVKELFYSENNGNSIRNSNALSCINTSENVEQHLYSEFIEDMNLVSIDNMYVIVYALHAIFDVAVAAARAMKAQEYIIDIVDAICDSNATKEIKGKVDPAIKANIIKGHDYVPPTERLQLILNKIGE